jgi:hypothetical protein
VSYARPPSPFLTFQQHCSIVKFLDASTALAAIHEHARAGWVAFTRHALERAVGNGLALQEIVDALCACVRCTWQPEHGTWRVEGEDWDGNDLVVALTFRDGVLVVTVFRRETT